MLLPVQFSFYVDPAGCQVNIPEQGPPLRHVFRGTCAFIDQSFMHQQPFRKRCGIMRVGIYYSIIDKREGLRGIIWMITVAVVTGY